MLGESFLGENTVTYNIGSVICSTMIVSSDSRDLLSSISPAKFLFSDIKFIRLSGIS